MTRGSLPVLYYQNGEIVYRVDLEKIERPNTVGCGDVFLAGLVVRYLETKCILKSIKFAGVCATLNTKYFGTAIINRDDISMFNM